MLCVGHNRLCAVHHRKGPGAPNCDKGTDMIRSWVFSGSNGTEFRAHAGLAVLRVFSGLSMALAHGINKIPPSEGFVQVTAGMGFPLPVLFAWLAGLAEFGGGLLLALGLGTRPAALAIGITMAVAGFVRHAPDPFRGKELALLYLAVMVLFALAGAGRFSVDAFIRARTRRTSAYW